MEGLHQRMGESNFGAIDGAIASSLDNGKVVRILRIEDDAVDSFLLVY